MLRRFRILNVGISADIAVVRATCVEVLLLHHWEVLEALQKLPDAEETVSLPAVPLAANAEVLLSQFGSDVDIATYATRRIHPTWPQQCCKPPGAP